jgi:cell division protein ZapA
MNGPPAPPSPGSSSTGAAKKHTVKVTILNEEYSIRSDTTPELTRAIAQHLDRAIREVMSSGAVVESNRAVVLAALQITAELFESRDAVAGMTKSLHDLSDYVRPLLPPAKRQSGGSAV